MTCARCRAENPAGMKFCGQCTAPLALVCGACGPTNPPTSKFCGQCAGLLDRAAEPRFVAPDAYTLKHLAEKSLTSRSALEGERKQVTVLFADLKGSMELLADRDPEEARKLLDPVLTLMMEAVHRYEGSDQVRHQRRLTHQRCDGAGCRRPVVLNQEISPTERER
jgi:hypothetical protein